MLSSNNLTSNIINNSLWTLKTIVQQLAERIDKQKDVIATEEATKNAFIMPFIQALGYDIFNPFEVVPEMDCDLKKEAIRLIMQSRKTIRQSYLLSVSTANKILICTIHSLQNTMPHRMHVLVC